MNYLVAVSGGIDSVVLLDKLVAEGGHELAVAHFDHGIRADSAADARFVAGLAEKYALPFVLRREELGPDASEELARDRRYAFLREEAKKRQAVIVTAHHADDVVETVAINILRGTGWRGLAVMDTPGIVRPLLRLTKNDLRAYAHARRLEWVEESTNASTRYLRNRLRRRIAAHLSLDDKQVVRELRERQVAVKKKIDQAVGQYMREDGTYGRYFFVMADAPVAYEVLRAAVSLGGRSITRPQASRALLAIKTARPHTVFEVKRGVRLRFSRTSFVVETL
jgi:tRNA(Ile)-lysidine synthetase-like protein